MKQKNQTSSASRSDLHQQPSPRRIFYSRRYSQYEYLLVDPNDTSCFWKRPLPYPWKAKMPQDLGHSLCYRFSF